MKAGRPVAVAGVGYSTCGRKTGLSYRELSRQATAAALADAGMTAADVDGITAWPGIGGPTPGGDAMDLAHLLGLTPVNWMYTPGQAPAFVDPCVHSIAAISAGLCDTCIVIRTMTKKPSNSEILLAQRQQPPPGPMRVGGGMQFGAPFGVDAPTAIAGGWQMQAHMDRYGTTEEQFGTFAVNQRYHASLCEDAIVRDPLTLEDYLDARYISKPTRLYDCDLPVDAGSAVVFTTAERARDLPKKPVLIEAYTLSAVGDMDYFFLPDDFTTNASRQCGEKLWSRTDIRPDDVDVAQMLDGYTVMVFQWLEALGFCGRGESGPFVEEGNTRLGGRIPVNTDGGACNVGRRHGANSCIETVRQLRGECGERQVEGAKVGLWANGAGPFSGTVLLTVD